jgi:hypothetical protein
MPVASMRIALYACADTQLYLVHRMLARPLALADAAG